MPSPREREEFNDALNELLQLQRIQREIEQAERAQDLQDPGGSFHRGFSEDGYGQKYDDRDYRDTSSASTRRGSDLTTSTTPEPGEIEWGDHPENEREQKLQSKCPDAANCLDENFCYQDYDCYECDYCLNFQCQPKADHKDCNSDRDCPCAPNEGQDWHCLDGGPKGDEEGQKCYLTCNEEFGCMPGYVCDPETMYCLPGCQTDEECKCGLETSAPDCIEGGVCIDNVCVEGCKDSEDCKCSSPNPARDCREAAVCEDGHCVAPCEVPIWCDADSDCRVDDGEVCVPYYGPRGISYPKKLELSHCISGCRKSEDCEPVCYYETVRIPDCSCTEEELEDDPDCFICTEDKETCFVQVCMADNTCDRPCVEDSTCATAFGEACVDNFCQFVGKACGNNNDCEKDQWCNGDGRCESGCRGASDCVPRECPQDQDCLDACPIDPLCTCEELPGDIDCEGVEWRQYCEKDPDCLAACPREQECLDDQIPAGQTCVAGDCMHLCSTDAECQSLYGTTDVHCIDPEGDEENPEPKRCVRKKDNTPGEGTSSGCECGEACGMSGVCEPEGCMDGVLCSQGTQACQGGRCIPRDGCSCEECDYDDAIACCTTNDCTDGLKCVEDQTSDQPGCGFCQDICLTDEDCKDGKKCLEGGYCGWACDPVVPCTETVDCPEGSWCAPSKICESGCSEDIDCAYDGAVNMVCRNFECVQGCASKEDCCGSGTIDDGRCNEDEDCGAGCICQDNYCRCGCQPGSPDECEPGYECMEDGFTCKHPCEEDINCPPDLFCYDGYCDEFRCAVYEDCLRAGFSDQHECVIDTDGIGHCLDLCYENVDCGCEGEPGSIATDECGSTCVAGECTPLPECLSNADCSGDEVCQQGSCGERDENACISDSDCDGDFVCQYGICEAPCLTECVDGVCEDAPQRKCYGDNECPSGEICSGGSCSEGCRSDGTCSGAKVCTGNKCKYRCWNNAYCKSVGQNVCQPGQQDQNKKWLAQCQLELEILKDNGAPQNDLVEKASECEAYARGDGGYCEKINEGDGDEGGSSGCECWEQCDETGNCAKKPCKNQSDCDCCACLTNGFCGEPTSDADCPGQRVKVDDDCTCEQPCMPELKCESDAECPPFAFCNGREGMCETGCRDESGCLPGQTCLNGLCIKACSSLEDCDYRKEKCHNGACIYTGYVCETSEDCPAGMTLCENGFCVQDYTCNISDECPGDELCINKICSPPPECNSDSDCPVVDVETCTVGDACDDETPCSAGGECRNGVCFYCTPGTQQTDCLQGQCTDKTLCNDDGDCFGGQICLSGACNQGKRCFGFADCDEREICEGGLCVEDTTCFQDSDCSPGQYCLGGNCAEASEGGFQGEYGGNTCEDCGTSCDPTSFTCRPTRCATDDDCEFAGGECIGGTCICPNGFGDCTDTGVCEPQDDGTPLFCCLDIEGGVREEDGVPLRNCYDCCEDKDCTLDNGKHGICTEEKYCVECRHNGDCQRLYPDAPGLQCVEGQCLTPCGTGLSTGDCFTGLNAGDTCDVCPDMCPDNAPCGESFRACGEYQVFENGVFATRFTPCNVCKQPCEGHQECGAEQICRKENREDDVGECGPDAGLCGYDSDCERLNRPEANLKYICRDAKCEEFDGPVCFANSDCGEGAVCDGGYCFNGTCGEENPCGNGFVCKENRCRFQCDSQPIACREADSGGNACPPGYAANQNVYDEEGNKVCRCVRHGYNGADPNYMGCPTGEMCLDGGCMPVVTGVRECGSDNDCRHLNKTLYGQEAELYVGGCGEGCRVDQVQQKWFCDINEDEDTGVILSMCQPAPYTYKYETNEGDGSDSGEPPPRDPPEPPGEEVDPCASQNLCCGDDGFCGKCECDADNPCTGPGECCDEGTGLCVGFGLHPETRLGIPDGCYPDPVFCKINDAEGNHVSPLGYEGPLYSGCHSEIVCEDDENGQQLCREEKECFAGGPLSDEQIRELMAQDCRPEDEEQDCDCDWGEKGPPPEESECQFDTECESCMVCKAEFWRGSACCPLSSELVDGEGNVTILDGVYRNICKAYYAEDSKEAEVECSCLTDDDCTECEVCDRTNRDQGFDGVKGDDNFGKCRADCNLCPCGGDTSYTNTTCSGCKKWGKCAIEGTGSDGGCACVIDRDNPCCEAYDDICDLSMEAPGCRDKYPDGKESPDSGCVEKTQNINGVLTYEQVAFCKGGRNGNECAQCTQDSHCLGQARCRNYECVFDCGDENVLGEDTRYCRCCDSQGTCRQLYETWQESSSVADGNGGEGQSCRPCACTEEGVDCQSYQSCESCWQWRRTDGQFTDDAFEYEAAAEAAFKADRFESEKQLYLAKEAYEDAGRNLDPLKEAWQTAEADATLKTAEWKAKCKECDCFLCGNNAICAPNCDQLLAEANAANQAAAQAQAAYESAETSYSLQGLQIQAMEDALLTQMYRPGEWQQVKVCECCIDGMCRSEEECAYGTCYLCPHPDHTSPYYRIQLYAKPGIAIGRHLNHPLLQQFGGNDLDAAYYVPAKCGNWKRNLCEEDPKVYGGGGSCNVYVPEADPNECIAYKCRDGISWEQRTGYTKYSRYYEYCTGSIIACAFEGLKPGYVDENYMNGYDFEFNLEEAGVFAGNHTLPTEDWIEIGGKAESATGSCRWPNGLGHIRGNELPTFEDVVYAHPCCFATEGVWECDPEHPDCSTKYEILYEPGDVLPLIRKLRRERDELEQYMTILQDQWDELQTFIEAKELEIEELVELHEDLGADYDQLAQDLANAKTDAKNLEDEIARLETKLEGEQAECDEKTDEYNTKNEELIAAKEQQAFDQSFYNAVQAQIATLEANVESIDAAIKEENGKAGALTYRIFEIENELLPNLDPESVEYLELEQELEAKKASLEEITGEGGTVDQLEGEKKDINEEIARMKAEDLKEAESNLGESTREVENLTNQVDTLRTSAAEACTRATQTKNALTTANNNLLAKNQEIERLEKQLELLGDDVSNTEDGEGDLERRINFLKDQITAAEEIQDQICTEVPKNAKCGGDGEMGRVQKRLDDLEKELERLEKEEDEIVKPQKSSRPAAGDAFTAEEIREKRKEEIEEAREKQGESWYP